MIFSLSVIVHNTLCSWLQLREAVPHGGQTAVWPGIRGLLEFPCRVTFRGTTPTAQSRPQEGHLGQSRDS